MLPFSIKNNVLEVKIAQPNSKGKMSPFSSNSRSQLNTLVHVSWLVFNVLYDSDPAMGKRKGNGKFFLPWAKTIHSFIFLFL